MKGLARVLVVSASVLAFVGVFAVWINRQLLNTDNWTRTSSELLADPVIRDQVAVFLVDQLYANVDVTGEIRNALPERLKPLAAPAASGLRQFAERGAKNVLARPRAQMAWENANRAAHEQLLRVLEGGGPTVSTQGGVVTLDLKLLLTQIADRVGVGGRVASALPAGAASITILRSDQLELAQNVLQVLKPLAIVLVALSLALFGIALAIAPGWRRNAVRAYGFGLVAGGAAVLVAASLAESAVVNSLATTAAVEPAVENAWDIITPLLKEAAVATIGYGVVLILGAWLAGPSGWAVAVRRGLAPYLREPVIAYAAFTVLIAVTIFWWAPTPATRNPTLAIILIALLTCGFEALRRKATHEFPDATLDDAKRRWRERYESGRSWVSGRASSGAQQASGAIRQGAATIRQAVPSGGPATAEEARLEQLERLARLRDAGALDAEEFNAEKSRVLVGAVATVDRPETPIEEPVAPQAAEEGQARRRWWRPGRTS
jgi:hypothetical protein